MLFSVENKADIGDTTMRKTALGQVVADAAWAMPRTLPATQPVAYSVISDYRVWQFTKTVITATYFDFKIVATDNVIVRDSDGKITKTFVEKMARFLVLALKNVAPRTIMLDVNAKTSTTSSNDNALNDNEPAVQLPSPAAQLTTPDPSWWSPDPLIIGKHKLWPVRVLSGHNKAATVVECLVSEATESEPTPRRVIVKFSRLVTDNEAMIARIETEHDNLQQYGNANHSVVEVSFLDDKSVKSLVLEPVGVALYNYVRIDGGLPARQRQVLAQIVFQHAAAHLTYLAETHKVTMVDVDPNNMILVQDDNENLTVRFIDFESVTKIDAPVVSPTRKAMRAPRNNDQQAITSSSSPTPPAATSTQTTSAVQTNTPTTSAAQTKSARLAAVRHDLHALALTCLWIVGQFAYTSEPSDDAKWTALRKLTTDKEELFDNEKFIASAIKYFQNTTAEPLLL